MMEYAPGGELFVRLAECGSYTEHEAKPIFAQIASAVQYMVIFLDIDYITRVLLLRIIDNKTVRRISRLHFAVYIFSILSTIHGNFS